MDLSGNLADLAAASFEPHANTTFETACGATLELTEVHAFGDLDGKSFSALFAHKGGGHLGQGIAKLTHGTLGELSLFLAPVGPGADGAPRYEAIFNRRTG